MCLMCYKYDIIHVPGKQLLTADALSRATCSPPAPSDTSLSEVADILNQVISELPASHDRLEEVRNHQQEDEISRALTHYVQSVWPTKHALPGPMK